MQSWEDGKLLYMRFKNFARFVSRTLYVPIEHYDRGYHILWSYHKLCVRKGKKKYLEIPFGCLAKFSHIISQMEWKNPVRPSKPICKSQFTGFLIVYHQGNEAKRGWWCKKGGSATITFLMNRTVKRTLSVFILQGRPCEKKKTQI